MEEASSSSMPRRVVVLRHGERVDLTFGSTWITETYVPTDLNMPDSLPPRETQHWERDAPLTKVGEFQASLIGASLKRSGIRFSHVIVSPAYRCLQTATIVLKEMGVENELPLNIEYGQFEWIGFYKDNLPHWFTEQEAAKIFNVNEKYQPIVSREEFLNSNTESLEEIYDYNSVATKEALKKLEGNVLIVAHGSNLETSTRELLGKPKRPYREVREIMSKVPNAALIAMEQVNDTTYKLVDPPCQRLTHKASPHFDWQIFDEELAQQIVKVDQNDVVMVLYKAAMVWQS